MEGLMKRSIYLAGGLFNAGERLHNLFLERALRELGYGVILPQREALTYCKDGVFDIDKIRNSCCALSVDPQTLFVGCLDGTDADSGMAVEYGLAKGVGKKAVVYRTDFRTQVERELGVNAMFGIPVTEFVYLPCTFTELAEVELYYRELATRIHEAILKIDVRE